MFQTVTQFLNDTLAPYWQALPTIATLLCIAVMAVLAYFAIRRLLDLVARIIGRTPTTWDDDLLNARMLRGISHLAPAVVVKWLLDGFFSDGGQYVWLTTITSLYIMVAAVVVVVLFISNLHEAMYRRPKTRPYAIKGVFQMIQLVVICIAVILAVSMVIGRSPVAILTAMGASAAVLMLVFKDTILGLVASVQLTANNMIKRGDWIECPSHNAGGEVVDISLTTVKVRNWDGSITTIPPYTLVSESFRNYDPMVQSGARRVERSILVDANSVRYCTPEEMEALDDDGWLDGIDIDRSKRQVNLHLLRLYLESWLAADPRVNTEKTLMVRQMAPTASGLPLNLYFFCNEVRWKQFENIQSDIFDHVLAITGQFGLRVFQSPGGADIRDMAQK